MYGREAHGGRPGHEGLVLPGLPGKNNFEERMYKIIRKDNDKLQNNYYKNNNNDKKNITIEKSKTSIRKTYICVTPRSPRRRRRSASSA